jgi:Thioesterase superfamily
MTTIDQTTHFLRPATFDVFADAQVVRIGRNASLAALCCSVLPTNVRSAW